MVLCGHRKQNWGQWAEDKKTIPPQDTKPAPQTNVLQPRSVLFPSTLVRFSNLGDGAGRGRTGGGFLPRDPAAGAAGTLDNDSNLFADRAQLVSGCATVGSSEVLGGLLRYIKVDDDPIPCTHQSWGRVALWDAGKHLIHSFYPYLVARAAGFPKARLVCKRAPKGT